MSYWQRFDGNNPNTWPNEDRHYVVIGGDDFMQVLRGRHNYFVRSEVSLFIELPELPVWYVGCQAYAPRDDFRHIPDPVRVHICKGISGHLDDHVCDVDGISWPND